MNHKNKYIIIITLALILISGFLYWYFFSRSNTKNETPTPLTDQQKFDILHSTSSIPANVVSEAEKNKVLNKIDKKVTPATRLSDEEILEILNKEN